MRKISAVLASLVVLVAIPTLAAGEDAGTPPSTTTPAEAAAKPTVVSTKYIRPKRVLRIKTKFTPWSQPTVSQVYKIIDIEAARWGVSAAGLHNRIRCESTYNWAASNGQYQGLGQFAPSTFARGVSTLGSRRVSYVKSRVRVQRVVRVRTFSDGRVARAKRWRVHQRIIHRFVGRIPQSPNLTHGWAQVRIMAQAIAGRSAVNNSEWECST